MTKLEKLNNELKRIDLEMEKLKEKKIAIENKIMLEEQSEISKLLKANNLNYNDLKSIIENQK